MYQTSQIDERALLRMVLVENLRKLIDNPEKLVSNPGMLLTMTASLELVSGDMGLNRTFIDMPEISQNQAFVLGKISRPFHQAKGEIKVPFGPFQEKKGRYFGSYRGGLMDGRGRMARGNMDIIDGNWENGELKGELLCVNRNGNTFVGIAGRRGLKGTVYKFDAIKKILEEPPKRANSLPEKLLSYHDSDRISGYEMRVDAGRKVTWMRNMSMDHLGLTQLLEQRIDPHAYLLSRGRVFRGDLGPGKIHIKEINVDKPV